jgi:hypothetical protein
MQPIFQGIAVLLPTLLVKFVGPSPNSFFQIIETSIQFAEQHLPILKAQERRELSATLSAAFTVNRPPSLFGTGAGARPRRFWAERAVLGLEGSGVDPCGRLAGDPRRTCRERLWTALSEEERSGGGIEPSACDPGSTLLQESHNAHGDAGGASDSRYAGR